MQYQALINPNHIYPFTDSLIYKIIATGDTFDLISLSVWPSRGLFCAALFLFQEADRPAHLDRVQSQWEISAIMLLQRVCVLWHFPTSW